MLSPDLVARQLGVSAAEIDANLCTTENFEAGIKALNEELLAMTELPLAKQQHQLMQEFHQALINDTTITQRRSP